jgi:transcriptional regulator with XRE-family HTH domain
VPRDTPQWIIERRRELGERIADLRTAAGYTQDSLCAVTGLSRSNLQRIESGEADPRFTDLALIADTLNEHVSVLGVTVTPRQQ